MSIMREGGRVFRRLSWLSWLSWLGWHRCRSAYGAFLRFRKNLRVQGPGSREVHITCKLHARYVHVLCRPYITIVVFSEYWEGWEGKEGARVHTWSGDELLMKILHVIALQTDGLPPSVLNLFSMINVPNWVRKFEGDPSVRLSCQTLLFAGGFLLSCSSDLVTSRQYSRVLPCFICRFPSF